MIAKIKTFIRDKISDKAMLSIGIALLCVYYFVGLLSYIAVPIKPISRVLASSSPLAIILRAFMCGLIVLYSAVIIIKYKPKIKWTWLIIFGFTLFMTLVCILLSPRSYDYSYVSRMYNVIHVIRLECSNARTAVMFLSSIADFVFAFCIMFILPFVINDKKKLLILLLPIVAIGLLECGYSAIFEKDSYIYMFNHPDDPFGGYNNSVGATFGNKEDWGSFLIVAISSSIASFYFVKEFRKKTLIRIGLAISILIMSIFVLFSLCKTAILALALIMLTLFVGYTVMSFYKSFGKGIIFAAILFVAIIFIILFLSTNGFGVPILGKIANYFNKLIIDRSESAIAGRSALWLNYMENVRGYNLFFGMGKNYVNNYTYVLAKEGQSSIHNGLVYFFASYGLIGFIVFVSLLFVALSNIIKTWTIDKQQVFLFLALFFGAFSFVLAEAEVLIISSSTPIFIFNVLVVMLPEALLEKRNKERLEMSL